MEKDFQKEKKIVRKKGKIQRKKRQHEYIDFILYHIQPITEIYRDS